MGTDRSMDTYIDILKQFTLQDFKREHLDKPMADLGINSYNAIEIMIAMEAEFHVVFPDSLITPELLFSPKTLFDGLMGLIARGNERCE